VTVVDAKGAEAVVARADGRYIDRFEQRNGQWRIARRQLVLEWGQTWRVPPPPDRAAIRSFQSPEDVSYRRVASVTRVP
jgi:hypothetical protein